MPQSQPRLDKKLELETRRKARALKAQVARKRSAGSVEIEFDFLKNLLALVTEPPPRQGSSTKDMAATTERPTDDEISPQQAAEILKMSRPSVMRLIEQGHLHTRKILTRNKLSRAEVIAFHQRNSREQRKALQALSSLSEEFDF